MYSSFQTHTGVAGASRRATVLLIDGQPGSLQAVCEALGSAHEMLLATSGAGGLATCQRQRPDLVLIDLGMPGLDGLAVANYFKRDPATRDIPIIFLTAGSAEDSACLEAGAVDFVPKPINPLALRRRVQVHLTIRRQAEELRRLASLDGLDLAHLLRHAHALFQSKPASRHRAMAHQHDGQ